MLRSAEGFCDVTAKHGADEMCVKCQVLQVRSMHLCHM